MASPSFVLFGSGPGIGFSVAKAFINHFDRIVLCSRNSDRLQNEKTDVEAAAKKSGRHVTVVTFETDLADHAKLKKTLSEIERLGPVGMIYHNAARINPGQPLAASAEEIHEDFLTGNLALYIIAEWAVPLLQASGHASPSFFVTNSHLPEEPIAALLSLSMSKASQQNMVLSLDQAFGKDIHFGVIKVSGIVAPENKYLNPTYIAEKALTLYEQERSAWEVLTYIKE